jgi:hypothetical protein
MNFLLIKEAGKAELPEYGGASGRKKAHCGSISCIRIGSMGGKTTGPPGLLLKRSPSVGF